MDGSLGSRSDLRTGSFSFSRGVSSSSDLVDEGHGRFLLVLLVRGRRHPHAAHPALRQDDLQRGRHQEHEPVEEEGEPRGQIGQQGEQDDEIEGYSVEVVDGRPLVLRDDVPLHGPHDGKVHADADLEQVHAQKGHRVAEIAGDDRHGDRADEEDPDSQSLDGVLLDGDAEEGGSGHAADHEGGEDQAEGQLRAFPRFLRGVREQRGPHEDEYVHRSLEEGRDDPAQQDVPVPHRGREGALQTGVPGLDALVRFAARVRFLPASEVFIPQVVGPGRAGHQGHDGQVEGIQVAARVEVPRHGFQGRHVGDVVRDQTRQDGHAGVEKGGPREALGKTLLGQVGIGVGLDEPGLEDGKEEGGGDTPEQPTEHEHAVASEMLRHAARQVDDREEDHEQPASLQVGYPADEAPEDHRGPEPRHEELRDIVLAEFVLGIEGVDVRSLEPIAEGRHQVHEEVLLEELVVGRLVLLAQLVLVAAAAGFALPLLVVIARTVRDRRAEGQKAPENNGEARHGVCRCCFSGGRMWGECYAMLCYATKNKYGDEGVEGTARSIDRRDPSFFYRAPPAETTTTPTLTIGAGAPRSGSRSASASGSWSAGWSASGSVDGSVRSWDVGSA
mmetsp:Transcript_7743/g.19127  ORF Transcript_7743/g.19127 Transcript_7743/m.19127 type:complete len:615 (+) Transcript_7743:147-1991(+)